jgi:hypothetical protein
MTIILLIYLFSAICVAVLVNTSELDSMYNCDKAVFILTPLLNTGVMLVAAYFGAYYFFQRIRD